MVPEVQSETDTVFCHFGPFFVLSLWNMIVTFEMLSISIEIPSISIKNLGFDENTRYFKSKNLKF